MFANNNISKTIEKLKHVLNIENLSTQKTLLNKTNKQTNKQINTSVSNQRICNEKRVKVAIYCMNEYLQ